MKTLYQLLKKHADWLTAFIGIITYLFIPLITDGIAQFLQPHFVFVNLVYFALAGTFIASLFAWFTCRWNFPGLMGKAYDGTRKEFMRGVLLLFYYMSFLMTLLYLLSHYKSISS